MRYPTPRTLKIQVGFAASSPILALSFFMKLRTRLKSPSLRPFQIWRTRASYVTTRPALSERTLNRSYSVAVSSTSRPATVARRAS